MRRATPGGPVQAPPASHAADPPLSLAQILAAAEAVLRRFGPAKATVVDVARALGVSHTAVYRHVASKAELRDLVLDRWLEATVLPMRAIAAAEGPAPERLRRLIDALIAVKRRRAAEDPELFTAYRTLAAEAQAVVARHLGELVDLTAAVVRAGMAEGAFRDWDPVAAGRCCSPPPASTTRPTPPSGRTRPSTRRTRTCGGCSWTGWPGSPAPPPPAPEARPPDAVHRRTAARAGQYGTSPFSRPNPDAGA